MEIYVKIEETTFLFKCLLCMDLEGYKHLDKDSNDLPRQYLQKPHGPVRLPEDG